MRFERGEILRIMLGSLIIVGFITTTAFLLHLIHSGQTIQDSTGAVFMMLGNISNMTALVVGYYFGSTQNSANKTTALVDIAKGGQSVSAANPPSGSAPSGGATGVQNGGSNG